ncbi:hypothetical protein [Paenibacillus sp. IHBB 10380]|uniref:hypothetical protein n=1 Tax=Paenibacillus sp. IHBB 10380 TaxID=1566358 RepID=UPI0011856437|nr:hypothetical protein [Paenibacillus sp. IHBB 10380]
MSRKTKRNHPLVKWKYHPPRTKGEASIHKNSGEGLNIIDYQTVEIEPIKNSKLIYGKTNFAKLESYLIKWGRPTSLT